MFDRYTEIKYRSLKFKLIFQFVLYPEFWHAREMAKISFSFQLIYWHLLWHNENVTKTSVTVNMLYVGLECIAMVDARWALQCSCPWFVMRVISKIASLVVPHFESSTVPCLRGYWDHHWDLWNGVLTDKTLIQLEPLILQWICLLVLSSDKKSGNEPDLWALWQATSLPHESNAFLDSCIPLDIQVGLRDCDVC